MGFRIRIVYSIRDYYKVDRREIVKEFSDEYPTTVKKLTSYERRCWT